MWRRASCWAALLWSALIGPLAWAGGEARAPACSSLERLDVVEAWPIACKSCELGRSFEVALRFVAKAAGEGGRDPVTRTTLRLDPGFVSHAKTRYGLCAAPVLRRVGVWLEEMQLGREELELRRRSLAKRALAAVAYRLLPGVRLTPGLEGRVAELAERFRRRTGRELVITSGRREALDQARAMVTKLRLGARLFRLYRNRQALVEIVGAYRRARRRRVTRREMVAAMGAIIARQVQRGVFLSEHLRDTAVDIRIRGLKRRHVRLLERLARQERGLRLKREGRPPHLHLAFPEAPVSAQ